MATQKDFVLIQGSTFSEKIRWETTPIVYKPITGITKSAPARITAETHNVPDGWRVAVVSVKGMTEINAPNPPREKNYIEATFIDANTIELNSVNAADYKAYSSGGYVQYYTPKDLTDYSARLTVKDKVGGTELLALTTENNGIVIDEADKFIELVVSALDSEAITWKKGVYDLELVSPAGEVTALLYGSFTVSREVTT
jgi:hypothetical protein